MFTSKMANLDINEQSVVKEVTVEMDGAKKTDILPTDIDTPADGKLEQEEVDNHLPIDHGWAWVILLGTYFNYFLNMFILQRLHTKFSSV